MIYVDVSIRSSHYDSVHICMRVLSNSLLRKSEIRCIWEYIYITFNRRDIHTLLPEQTIQRKKGAKKKIQAIKTLHLQFHINTLYTLVDQCHTSPFPSYKQHHHLYKGNQYKYGGTTRSKGATATTISVPSCFRNKKWPCMVPGVRTREVQLS